LSYETLKYEQDGPVVVLTYNRPEARNAVSVQMNEELHSRGSASATTREPCKPSPCGVLGVRRT
jgi:1,4-dihydroxy-2-naphthoyl-CoA synthase